MYLDLNRCAGQSDSVIFLDYQLSFKKIRGILKNYKKQ